MAEDDGATHLVLLQSEPDEFACCASRSACRPSRRFDVLAPEPTPDPATLGYVVEEVTFRAAARASSWPAR